MVGRTKDTRYRASACVVNTDARTAVKIISPTTPLSCLILSAFSITQDCVRVIIINWESVVHDDREQK